MVTSVEVRGQRAASTFRDQLATHMQHAPAIYKRERQAADQLTMQYCGDIDADYFGAVRFFFPPNIPVKTYVKKTTTVFSGGLLVSVNVLDWTTTLFDVRRRGMIWLCLQTLCNSVTGWSHFHTHFSSTVRPAAKCP